ncbi:hypothetical protein GON04_08045 [Ramlibacter sp. MAH-25]|uniref:Uncharacterized protein n=1 Tax=Ramlibacter pinisoli TaxID=2682844 RepID=A0A6N8IRD9_9BURK|nr:hypothetical protein [Ramlibacter sp. CGMCC 1.13660]MVQ29394.1 hypothetical protein [Ramlibacter pinisoli]
MPPVTITGKASGEPVEKSYRRMLRGMDLFEREHALAPLATLRFQVLPRKPGVRLDDLGLYVVGKTVEIPLDVAPDRTFALPRDRRAVEENAQVSPDRPALTLTWRADIRSPGLPPGTRRLGDLRLECMVGIEAGLVSNSPSWIAGLFAAAETPAYCQGDRNRYLFFAERPLFGVTLVAGERREALPVRRLWAGAMGDLRLKDELHFCDCEVLVDRSYFAPLEDRSWPDDTLLLFEFMEDGRAPL